MGFLVDLSTLHIGNAAGEVKLAEQVAQLVMAPVTDIVVGSITVEERAGNHGNTFWASPDDSYAVNARGLPGPGIDYYRKNGQRMGALARENGKRLIVSIASTQSDDDWSRLAECASTFADGIEINVSCPNKWKNGERESVIAENPEAVNSIITRVRSATREDVGITVKIPPYKEFQKSSLVREMIDLFDSRSGAISGIVSCNTIGGIITPSIEEKPVLDVPQCGMSGPKIRPWSIGQLAFFKHALSSMSITGVGGIRSGVDVHEYLDSGASGVQIGTHFFQYGPKVFQEILADL